MRLISTKQGAELTGKSRWTVLRALRRGELPGCRVGRSWLLDVDALEQMIAARRDAGAAR